MTVPLSQAERDALHAFEARMRTRYGARLRGLVLFGSRARRDHRKDSDLDVAVVLAAPVGDIVAEALSMADDAFDVLLEQGLHIQPLPIEEGSLDHPEAHPIPHLTRGIARDGVAL